MDEPLAALDKRLRKQMQQQIETLHTRLSIMVVYVTHDQTEAMVMSDRIAIFHQGKIQQLDTPRRVHESPANGFTAPFVGDANSAEGQVLSVDGKEAQLWLDAGFKVRGIAPQPIQHGTRRSMFVGPQRVRIGSAEKLENRARGTVRRVTYSETEQMVLAELEGRLTILADLGVAGEDALPPGTRVTVGWSVERCLIMETGMA